MERNTHPFRLRLNLFDIILLIVAVAVAGGLLWFSTRSSQNDQQTPTASTVEYTVLFRRMTPGTSQLIQVGDSLVDTIKNYQLGTVLSIDIQPAVTQVLNQESKTYVDAVVEGYDDVYLTVSASCTQTDDSILVDGGYDLRVGQTTYVRGPGYMGSGPVISIERGE